MIEVNKLAVRILEGRESTMLAGAITIDIVDCRTCGAKKHERCKTENNPTNYIHVIRRADAIHRLRIAIDPLHNTDRFHND